MFRLRIEVSFMFLVVLCGIDLLDIVIVLFYYVRFYYLYIDDVWSDFFIKKVDINILVEIKFCRIDIDCLYNFIGYIFYRNDYS